jgi:NAD(P)-dependent dehydrogenase (short-subunit alcohol dehydrogenase family)
VTADELAGLVALVTGGGAGIGAAITAELRSRGARVAVLDVQEGQDDDWFRCDVTDRAQVETAVEAVLQACGRLDIVVNNAGIAAVGTVEDNDDDEWRHVLDVNVVGMARVSAAALPALRRSPAPAIVNVCSIAALNGLPQRALYSASKGAVLALTFAMAADHVREGIRVNAVSPGTVHTAFVDRMLQQFDDPVAERAALDARQATGRMVTTEEVAGAVAYLASPRSGSTTGTALEVDGGVTHLRVRPE